VAGKLLLATRHKKIIINFKCIFFMKTNYFLKSLALIALMVFALNVSAKEIPVANGATDTQLAAALDQAVSGDVILINGWITMNATVVVAKNVTFKAGPSATSGAGFDGGSKARLFEIHPADPVEAGKVTFDGLDFTGGDGWQATTDEKGGGVAIITDGAVVDFISCYFYENQAKRGGVFFITGAADKPTTTVTLVGCEAFDNVAFYKVVDSGESRAGYLFTDGNTSITHAACKIYRNQAIGGRGGALCLFGSGTRLFYYCVLSDNKGGNWGPDPANPTGPNVKLDPDGKPSSTGEYEGGLAFITGGATTFESCGIVNNQSWSHGGIIRGWGDVNTTVTFINSTVALNKSLGDRPPFWISGQATYTFVNSLIVQNQGSNAGNGSGYEIHEQSKLNVFNSVFARNDFSSGEGVSDIRANDGATTAQLTVKNSLIGFIWGDPSKVVVSDNPNIPTISNIRMYQLLATGAAAPMEDVNAKENSGVDFTKGFRTSDSFGMFYYLLNAGSLVTKLGDPALLKEVDRDNDLFGRKRPIAADGFTTAAPTLADTPDYFDDSEVVKKTVSDYTEIVTPTISTVKDNIRIISASNGTLAVDFGNLRGYAVGTLVNINGQEVEKVFDANVVSKGYYNIHTAPGMYLLKVVIGGKTYAQKLIVTK
jgi:hypothetical protein